MNFLLVFFLSLLFITGLIFAKINIEVNTIDIKLNDYYKKITKIDDLNIEIDLYWFSIIKIIRVKLRKNKIFINGIRYNINLDKFTEKNQNKFKDIVKKNKNFFLYGLKNLDLELKYSTTNSCFTALIYPLICTAISNYISRTNEIIVGKVHVIPYFYNVNSFKLSISFIYKFHLFEIFSLRNA